ncbi:MULTISPECIES: YcnI family protein [unclassified Microbacterium]|uniref:YcnI family copper-binding membrane protein n=1 Tax=unclassified Microbacterium TaxID=2609290 RepID=UPI001605235E|nr:MULTISPECIES: YcnI family protein [unclassified Microbacterium]QNA92406.1 YcnI family protein [Microbacterium sp. Se63.02b]QYM65698.1 YcnI family protein [Microbacterium sp. Se5.02b]
MSRNTRTRRTALSVAGVLGGAILAVALPSMASAHVGVSPDELAVGDHGVLTFSFSHGCEDSPTTALRITMPDGLASVAPTMDGDWNIQVERGDDGLVSAVTYTALTPVPNGLRGAVSMSVGVDENTPESLAFPVVQECVEGSTEWTQLAEDGEDPHSLDAPAPVVSVSADASGAHGQHDDAQSGEATSAASGAADPLAVALGAGGLAAGIAGLVVAVLAYRRRA